jgi:hypothetical protein
MRPASPGAKPKPGSTRKVVLLPKVGKRVVFHHRATMVPRATHAFRAVPKKALPPVTLPVDWSSYHGKPLNFPMDLNDTYGDCMVAAALHADGTWTGCNGCESTYDDAVTGPWYLSLAGGDNGLDEGTLLSGWKDGLDGVADATYLVSVDVDPTNAALAQNIIAALGGLFYMLSVPEAWVNNFSSGCVWDAPATYDDANGHGTWLNGVDTRGFYRLETWGDFCWVTPAGIAASNPAAFALVSLRWFDSSGVAPNGMSYQDISDFLVGIGGSPLPPSPFPGPTPPPGPGPGPGPGPSGAVALSLSADVAAGMYELIAAPSGKRLAALARQYGLTIQEIVALVEQILALIGPLLKTRRNGAGKM